MLYLSIHGMLYASNYHHRLVVDVIDEALQTNYRPSLPPAAASAGRADDIGTVRGRASREFVVVTDKINRKKCQVPARHQNDEHSAY